ncbi:BTAD domain-containing putative transcriptional regulator [Mesorhizobium sp. M4A.F.Ca.ET.050.02.1.1]|uniref:BTAD domain-containing putative transcriptional regulator n=1 Tax=Mesorhizobium sp. M4A.F.Ca.ET.050.02.1.1 TaxID=2496754 RepID=UPI00167CC257|nr:BTAD domain-containing putative transcriptional regulator [Mesorhizobium sp. M4A.F.Ca.ET.050.02.1.1]
MGVVAVEITLFGDFGLKLATGQDIDLPGQKDRALLAFLALSPGTNHTRDKLANLLWCDRGDQQARDSLKHALTRVRHGLQASAASPIVADRRTVKLDPAAVKTDVATFERLLREGTPQSLHAAAALYRGEIIEDVSVRSPPFEDWLLLERRRLRHLLEAALTRAIADSIANGELGFAAEAARRLHLLDPLNEAASRAIMQAEAEAGQTVQALRRYQGLRDRLRAELGVKPAPETIRLYEAIRDRAAEEPVSAVSPVLPSTAEMPLPERPAVAVLPFENLSGDADQQYFSDGISEDIITELSRFRSLFVIARHSSFAFKGRPVKVQEIARELGVAYVVEGSFRRVGDRVRISAQLVDAGRGTQLWAEKYDRELVDIFAVQDDVARSVAAAVCGRVDVASRDRVERMSPDTLRAYDLVLRAKFLTLNYTRSENAQAREFAERAATLDPKSAAACTHAAWCLFYEYMAKWTRDSGASLQRAFDYAQRAVLLDETDSFAHTLLGIVHLFRREFDQAHTEILAGVALNPNDFLARRYYGMFLAATGNAESGIAQIELGRRLNPFDTRWVPWDMGIVCFTARRYQEAITALKQARNPINEVHGWLAASYAQAGLLQEARSTLEHFLRVAEQDMAVFPGRKLANWEPYWHGAFEYQDQADFDHLFDALRKAGLDD